MSEEKNNNTKKKTLNGVVSKVIDDKTAKVTVSRTYRHPLYLKVMRADKKYLVQTDDPVEEGMRVEITESKPISKRKKFTVSKIFD